MDRHMFACRINIAPAGKGRPRATAFVGKDGKPKGRIHPDKRSDALEEQMALEFGRLYRGPTFASVCGVKIVAVLPRPLAMFRKKDDLARIPGDVKPDADNVAKLVLDAMQRCRRCGARQKDCKCDSCWPLLKDDSLVCRLVVQKWRGAISNRQEKIVEEPHIAIRIAEATAEELRRMANAHFEGVRGLL